MVAIALAALAVMAGCATTHSSDYDSVETEHLDFLAGSEGRFTHSGAHAGGGWSRGFEDFDLASGVSVDDSDGFHLSAGYRGSRYLDFEAVLEHFPSFDSDAAPISDFESTNLSANLKVYPTGGLEGNLGRIQPYALVGFGIVLLEADPTDVRAFRNGRKGDDYSSLFRWGGGVDLYLTENVYLTGEVARIQPEASRADRLEFTAVNIGIEFRY